MQFELSPDLKHFQAAARHFVESELIPHELTVDEHEALPPETVERIRRKALDCGLWPMNVPKEMGGLGSSVMEQIVAQEQAGRATNGLWAHVGGPYNALMRCNEAQREKYLKPALEGEWTVAYAVTEPGAGSDTTNLKTTAVEKGDRWVINGEKWFVSGGHEGLAVLVHALTGPGEETLFLVDHGTPGMRLIRTPRFMHRQEDRHPDSATELYAARLMTYKTAWEEDTGRVDPKELHTKASMCKLYCAEMAGCVADRAVQIFGGRGYCADYAAERSETN